MDARGVVQAALKRTGHILTKWPVSPPEYTLEAELQRVIADRQIDTILDVGAHIGGYGHLLRSIGFTGDPTLSPSERTLALQETKCRWPEVPIFYLQHPDEFELVDPPPLTGVEYLDSVADWRETLYRVGSYPLITVSIGSTLAYLVRRASGGQTVSPLVLRKPLDQFAPDERWSIEAILNLEGWGPRELIVLNEPCER